MDINPWVPMTEPIDLKHIGKLIEELGECISAAARCQIQGIDEVHPVTGKSNREWLEEEIADVNANIELVCKHFQLDSHKIYKRSVIKEEKLKAWHALLG